MSRWDRYLEWIDNQPFPLALPLFLWTVMLPTAALFVAPAVVIYAAIEVLT